MNSAIVPVRKGKISKEHQWRFHRQGLQDVEGLEEADAHGSPSSRRFIEAVVSSVGSIMLIFIPKSYDCIGILIQLFFCWSSTTCFGIKIWIGKITPPMAIDYAGLRSALEAERNCSISPSRTLLRRYIGTAIATHVSQGAETDSCTFDA